jgi:hypothetical protein
MLNVQILDYQGVESTNHIQDLKRLKVKVGHLNKVLILIICNNLQKTDNLWLPQDLSLKVKKEEGLKRTKLR